MRANKEQCSKEKKKDMIFAEHILKGTPHGIISSNLLKKHTIWLTSLDTRNTWSISYYIDKYNNVYDHTDIINNKKILM